MLVGGAFCTDVVQYVSLVFGVCPKFFVFGSVAISFCPICFAWVYVWGSKGEARVRKTIISAEITCY